MKNIRVKRERELVAAGSRSELYGSEALELERYRIGCERKIKLQGARIQANKQAELQKLEASATGSTYRTLWRNRRENSRYP